MIRLIAHPGEYAGKQVWVGGVFARDGRDAWLFQSREAWLGWDYASAVYLSRAAGDLAFPDDAASGRVAIAVGEVVFDSKTQAVGLRKILKIQILEKQRQGQ